LSNDIRAGNALGLQRSPQIRPARWPRRLQRKRRGYGWTVHSPLWDFGKLLDLYVMFFFLTAQAISWLAFKQIPSLAVLVGGMFIITGGIIIATAST
jgi:hypothetical protein